MLRTKRFAGFTASNSGSPTSTPHLKQTITTAIIPGKKVGRGAPPLRICGEAHERAFFAVVLRRPDQPLGLHAAAYSKLLCGHRFFVAAAQALLLDYLLVFVECFRRFGIG